MDNKLDSLERRMDSKLDGLGARAGAHTGGRIW